MNKITIVFAMLSAFSALAQAAPISYVPVSTATFAEWAFHSLTQENVKFGKSPSGDFVFRTVGGYICFAPATNSNDYSCWVNPKTLNAQKIYLGLNNQLELNDSQDMVGAGRFSKTVGGDTQNISCNHSVIVVRNQDTQFTTSVSKALDQYGHNVYTVTTRSKTDSFTCTMTPGAMRYTPAFPR